MSFYTISRSFLKGLFKIFYSHEVILPQDTDFQDTYSQDTYIQDAHFQGTHIPKGAIIAANHASFLDPPLIAISWPEPIHFLARKSLFDVPLLKSIISGLNAHPLGGRHDLSSLKLACKLIQEGKKVLIFPEGTRSSSGELSHLKPGIGMLVQRANCPVIPAYIHGSFQAWSKKRRFPKLFGCKTACIFGKPLYFSGTDMDGKSGQQEIARQLEKQIRLLRDSYLKGL